MSATEEFAPAGLEAPRGGLFARHGRTLLGVAVSVVSLAAVGWWISSQPAPHLPDSPSGLAWFGLALGTTLLTLVLRGWRWHRVLALAAVDHRRSDAIALTTVGCMGNTVLPARGGDVLRITLLGARSASRKREILGTVIAERALDVIGLVTLFVALSLGLAASPAGVDVALIVGAGLVLGFVALFVYLAARRRGHFERFAATVRPVARASRVFAQPQGIALIGLSVAIWSIDGLGLVALAQSIGLGLGALDAIMVVTLASLAAAIPAAPGFAGTYDGAMALALKAAGVAGGAAVGLLLIARFVFFVPAAVIGLVVLVARYGGFTAGRASAGRG